MIMSKPNSGMKIKPLLIYPASVEYDFSVFLYWILLCYYCQSGLNILFWDEAHTDQSQETNTISQSFLLRWDSFAMVTVGGAVILW